MFSHAKKLGVVAAAAVLVALLGPAGAAQERGPQTVRRVVKPDQPAKPAKAAPVPGDASTATPGIPTTAQASANPVVGPQPTIEEMMTARRTVRYDSLSPVPEAPPMAAEFGVTEALPPPNPNIPTKTHPAVGAWFGQAIQVCSSGVAPSACNQGTPAYTLFMTPMLLPDGLFVADDTGHLSGPPDGPHTAAFGQWYPTSETEFTADYLFMTLPYPVVSGALAGLRARWVAKVIDADTMVGWVNAYLMPKTPITWKPLLYNEFPTLPPEALTFVTSPNGFVTDPLTCRTPGCPVLVLKFTVKRIKQ